MYIVTKDGHKLPVDTSSLPEDRMGSWNETVGCYSSDTILREIWMLTLEKNNLPAKRRECEYEFVRELRYDHEPTKEDMLWAMSAYGLSRYGMVRLSLWGVGDFFIECLPKKAVFAAKTSQG